MEQEFNLSEKWFCTRKDKRNRYLESDVKEFIKRLKECFDESADKTDIWDNERYDKFRKIFKKEIDKLAGDKLI